MLTVLARYKSALACTNNLELLLPAVETALKKTDRHVALRLDSFSAESVSVATLISIKVGDDCSGLDAVLDVTRNAIADAGAVGWEVSLLNPRTNEVVTEVRQVR